MNTKPANKPSSRKEKITEARNSEGPKSFHFHHATCGGPCIIQEGHSPYLLCRCDRCHRRGLVPLWTEEGEEYPHPVIDLADWGLSVGLKLVDLLPEAKEDEL
jgi:hypothetical protein